MSDEFDQERFFQNVEEEAEKIKKQKESQATNGKAEQDKQTETQAQQLAKISTSGAALFHAPNGAGYADIIINGHRETWLIRGQGFRKWLVREFYKRDGAVPNSNAMQSALGLIEAIAQFDGPERKVSVRVAGDAGKFYLDLGDAGWNVIEIDAKGWRLVQEPPVRFRRANGMLPLPIGKTGTRTIYISRRGFKPIILMDRNDPSKDYNIRPYRGWIKLGRVVRKGERSVFGLFHIDQTDVIPAKPAQAPKGKLFGKAKGKLSPVALTDCSRLNPAGAVRWRGFLLPGASHPLPSCEFGTALRCDC